MKVAKQIFYILTILALGLIVYAGYKFWQVINWLF
jgi:hypothetical protein